MLSVAIVFGARLLLVMLFFPFSAIDKVLNHRAAVDQARKAAPAPWAASGLIAVGFCVEVCMSLAILTGIADRLAALVLAGYCVVTALLWKQFWKEPDFRLRGASKGREVFWEFLKNVALAGGLLLLAIGTTASGVRRFLDNPIASSDPYVMTAKGQAL